MGHTAYDSARENSEYKLLPGLVVTVDSTNQTMSVQTRLGVQQDITINHNISVIGTGLRVMPIPYMTRVLLYNQGKSCFHIGTFYNQRNSKKDNIGLGEFTNDPSYSKEVDESLVLQRNLDYGEISLTGIDNSEILLSANGDVLIMNSSLVSIELLADLQAIYEQSESNIFESSNVASRIGHAVRRSKGSIKDFERYFKTSQGVIGESKITSFENIQQEVYEFNVEIGCRNSENTSTFDDSIDSSDISLCLSNHVLDNSGKSITQNANPLYLLLDLKPTNIRVYSDYNGDFGITSTDENAPKQSIIAHFGEVPEFSQTIKDTTIKLDSNDSVSIDSLKYNMTISGNGDLTYSLGNLFLLKVSASGAFEISKKDADGNTLYSFKTNQDNDINIETKSKYTLKSGDGDPESSLLGESTVKLLAEVFNAIATHEHPVSNATKAEQSPNLASLLTKTEQVIKDSVLSKSVKQS